MSETPRERHYRIREELRAGRPHVKGEATFIGPLPELPPPPPPPPPGAGTYIKRWLEWAGIQATPGCGCADMARKMDLQGPDWCVAHAEEILDAMQAESHHRGLIFNRWFARKLLDRAIRKARDGAVE